MSFPLTPDAGKITVDHEEIPGYMSAMVMSIAVRDPAILSDVRSGDRIEFELLREGSELLITRINVTESRSKGEAIFKANCATCHGDRGQGTKKVSRSPPDTRLLTARMNTLVRSATVNATRCRHSATS